jgi:hypothetical protein
MSTVDGVPLATPSSLEAIANLNDDIKLTEWITGQRPASS